MDIERSAQPSPKALLPIMGAVFAGFLTIGLAMPVLPLHVHHGLGLGTFVVGLVAGSQFAVAIVSRPWAGRYADGEGPKRAVITGLLVSAAAGLLYLLSLRFADEPATSGTLLLFGRALLGAGESFIITGAQSWGLALAGPQNTGTVLAWMGSAMFAAFALGAPAGTALYTGYGFAAIAIATTLAPLASLLLVARLRPVAPAAAARAGLNKIFAAVWLPGVGAALSGVGFGAILAFLALLFAERGWPVWPAFTVFAITFALTRLFLGHLADRVGGARVALVCVLVEAAGLASIWLAPWSAMALIGAALTGFGYSLVYPAFGVEAIRRAPPANRGLAMAAYSMFLDVALALASPALGLIAAAAGLTSVFLVSTFVVLCAAGIAVRLLQAPSAVTDGAPAAGLEPRKPCCMQPA